MIDPVQCWKAVCQERSKPLYSHSEFEEMESKLYLRAKQGLLDVNLLRIAPNQQWLGLSSDVAKKRRLNSIESHFRAKGFYVHKGILYFGKNLDGTPRAVVVEAGE